MKFDRTKNALRNIIFGLLQRIYQLIVPFAMRTAMIYWLGVEYLGLDGLFISVLSVLNLAELGVGSAMVYSMYKPVAEDDRTTICALMKLYKIYYRVIGLVVLVGGLILCPFIPKLISDELPAGMNVYILFLLNLGATVLSYWLFAYKNSILQAYQRADVVSKVNYVEMKPSIRCFANIGADGIDGALSTYLGQGESEEKPVYLLIGDLSLMYDMNALLQKLPHNIRIVVINNYSGAEFHKNFGLDRIPTLNKHIAAGHRVKIANCCINSQFKYLAATNMEEVREALTILNTESEKPILLEVFTDADKDAKILKSYWMTNRQEIPGMKLSGKARVKQIVRNILGNKAYAIREMFKK